MDGGCLRNCRGTFEWKIRGREKRRNTVTRLKGKDLSVFKRERDLCAGRILQYLSSTGWQWPFCFRVSTNCGYHLGTGNDERLIKIVLKGLMGPIEVNNQKYAGQVPMTPFGGLLNDEEVAAVITYVRNSFGNEASVVTPQQVKKVRDASKSKIGILFTGRIVETTSAGKMICIPNFKNARSEQVWNINRSSSQIIMSSKMQGKHVTR